MSVFRAKPDAHRRCRRSHTPKVLHSFVWGALWKFSYESKQVASHDEGQPRRRNSVHSWIIGRAKNVRFDDVDDPASSHNRGMTVARKWAGRVKLVMYGGAVHVRGYAASPRLNGAFGTRGSTRILPRQP